MGKLLPGKIVPLRGLCSTQAFAVFAATETIQLVQWRIACLGGDSLGIQRRNEVLGRNACKVRRIEVEDVSVLPVTGAAGIALLRSDSWNIREQLVEHPPISMPMYGLLFQPAQLDIQNRTLPFTEPVVR